MRPSRPSGDPRRLSALLADERGSASLEFLTVGMLLLVPLVYLVVALSQIQHAVLAVEGASRHAARVVADAASAESGLAAADRAVTVAMAEAPVEAGSVAVSISCAPVPTACTTARGTVAVEIRARVPLPLSPPVLGLDASLAVPVAARSVQPVSAFAGMP